MSSVRLALVSLITLWYQLEGFLLWAIDGDNQTTGFTPVSSSCGGSNYRSISSKTRLTASGIMMDGLGPLP